MWYFVATEISVPNAASSDVRAEAIGFYRKGREHIDKTNGLKWCLYSFLWTRLTPLIVRRYILAAYRRIVKTENIN